MCDGRLACYHVAIDGSNRYWTNLCFKGYSSYCFNKVITYNRGLTHKWSTTYDVTFKF